jgi:hypothetical protein
LISLIITAYRTPKLPDYASEFVTEVRHHEPDIEIILVDCNSRPPYPQSKDYRLVNVDLPYNIGRMTNTGIRDAKGDWLMIANDDVTCWGVFSDRVHGLDKAALWCKEIAEKSIHEQRVPTVYGWLVIMHRTLYDELGAFDETNPISGLDVDYSLRALKAGYPVGTVNVPFRHLHHHRRY